MTLTWVRSQRRGSHPIRAHRAQGAYRSRLLLYIFI